jgi:hypothetical protein
MRASRLAIIIWPESALAKEEEHQWQTVAIASYVCNAAGMRQKEFAQSMLPEIERP